MQELATLASIVAALSVGVISPGPSFVMVARVAVASSRIRALATALGMGAGGAIFGAAALLGLQSVLLAVPALYAALKVLGGLYLCYLGFLIFRSAQQPLAAIADSGKSNSRPLHAFWLASQHRSATRRQPSSMQACSPPFSLRPLSFAAALLAVVLFVETAWYALVALLFSSSGPQRVYLSSKAWIDRAAGAFMFALGLKLVTSAAKP